MATINPATTYPDGAPLDIPGHNTNVFSTTPGRGVMSEPNGKLELANLTPGFKIRAEHVMSEEAVFARVEGNTTPFDLYNNLMGESSYNGNLVAVASVSQRVYLPRSSPLVLWQCGVFVSAWQPLGLSRSDDQYTVVLESPMILVPEVNGSRVGPELRLPTSARMYHEFDAEIVAASLQNYEQVMTRYAEIAVPKIGATAGWVNFSLKLYMPPLVSGERRAVPLDWFAPVGTRNLRTVVF